MKTKLNIYGVCTWRRKNGLILAKTYDELISIIKDEKLITDISKIDNYDLLVNYFIKNTNLYR